MIVLDVKSDQIRCLSFDVTHDESLLDLTQGGLSLDDTTTQALLNDGFLSLRRIEPVLDSPATAGGYVFLVVFGFHQPIVLPLGRVPLVRATYTLKRDVENQGTALMFAEGLGNPPVQVVLSQDLFEFPEFVERNEGNCIDGRDNDGDGLADRDDPDCVWRNAVSRVPRKLIDGLIRKSSRPGLEPGRDAPFHRGDANTDGRSDISDAVFLMNYLHVRGPSPACLESADADDDGAINLADASYLLTWLFLGTVAEPASPGPWPAVCGTDPATSRANLGCEAYSHC